jgi:spore maturation protein CgeB
VPSLKVFDHVFIFDRSYLPHLETVGVRRAHFLPCACDETIYRPLRLSSIEQRRYRCDVALVAWYYPARAQMVRALADEMDVKVWGGHWDSLDARQVLGPARVVHGSSVSDQTAARIYNAARIGLNVHQSQSRLGGLNTRTFELLACGIFQLVDRVGGLEELLRQGDEVVCYESAEELRRLAKHYLADGEARVRIAARGRARVLEEHTYTRRMHTLCEVARG